MATAEHRAERGIRVPPDPTPEQYPALAQKEKQVRKDNEIKESELSVLIDEKGPFGLFSISIAKKVKDSKTGKMINVRDTSVPPLYMWLALEGAADVPDLVAYYTDRYGPDWLNVLIQRTRSAETVFRRSQRRLKGGAGRGRGRKFRSSKVA